MSIGAILMPMFAQVALTFASVLDGLPVQAPDPAR
jgi:hypothetical protein